MLIFKWLEFSNYGAECFFLYDDIKNFYIATKNVFEYSANKEDTSSNKIYEDFIKEYNLKERD